MEVPTLEEVKSYTFQKIEAKGEDPKIYSDWLTDKYEAWEANGWKKEKGAKLIPIKNWKSTILQCLAYRQPNKVKPEIKKAEVVSTGAYDNIQITALKQAYNSEREGNYIKVKYSDVYDFLVEKKVINPKSSPAYFKKISKMAQGFILASIIDELKTAKGERKDQLEIQARSVKRGLDARLWPKAKALILTDVFQKYSLQELLDKVAI